MTKREFQEWLDGFPEDDDKHISIGKIPTTAKVTDITMKHITEKFVRIYWIYE